MRKVTVCFLVRDNQLCLAMKKRGFGIGKWNGVGGKVENNESLKDAAIRELKEEIGVVAKQADLEEVGDIKFQFEKKPDWSQHMHIYLIKNWRGEPKETEEMAPKWYAVDSIPYGKMWIDDPYWLPKVLEGKKIEGHFHFSSDGDVIKKYEVREI